MGIEIILEITLVLIAIVIIVIDIVNHKLNVSNNLEAAAGFLNAKVQKSLSGNYVSGCYKGRSILFDTVIEFPDGLFMAKMSFVKKVIRISSIVNINPRDASIAAPTENTYLERNRVTYKSQKQKDWLGIKSGCAYKKDNLPIILDELVRAADIVEKKYQNNSEKRVA